MPSSLRALVGLLALSGIGAACSPPPAPRPNVLLVTIDTLRADHVGAYGSTLGATPTLDALAAGGVRLRTAFAPAPLTLPSHASILTGLYPPHHGVRHNGAYHLDEAVETLAERLRAEGYHTAAVVGAAVLARRFGLAQGFELYDDAASPRAAVAGGFLERDARSVTDRALDWLAEAREPFFLWVHYYDPHFEYRPPAPFGERFAAHPYAGEIAFVDAQLTRLLQAVPGERTCVVATADHGESLGEHGEVTHGYGLYDATLSVPLLWSGPGIPAGRVVDGIASSVDIAPTLLSLLGLDPLASTDGRDLSAAWRGAGFDPPRRAYAETLATRIDHGWSPLFALRSRDTLYVRSLRPELYDLPSDPPQLRNLLEAPTPAARARADGLERELTSWLPPEDDAAIRFAPPEVATRAKLAALGYALPDAPLPETGIDPKDGLRWLPVLYAAQQAFGAGRLEEAETLAAKVVSALPRSAEAHALLARILMLEGRLAPALEHARQAAERVPRSARYRALLGNARLNAGDVAGAAADYRAAAALDDTHPLARAGLLYLAARAGRRDEALEHERVAVAGDPSNAELRAWIAALFERAGLFEDAARAYADALVLDPDSPSLHMAMAIQRARQGREAESEHHLAAAGDLAAAPHWRNRLAVAYVQGGQPERAEALFRELIESHPDYPSARRNLALLLRQRGLEPEAERLARGAP